MLAIGTAFLFTNAGKPIATANEIGEIKENVAQQVMRLANLASDEEETEDPEEVFSRAIEDYKEEFDDYINITARRLILEAGTGFTSNKPEINLKNLNIKNGDKLPKFGFSHFHNYTAAGIRDNGKPQVYAHSFFGLLKWAPNEDGVAVTHPDSPKN